MDRTNESNGEAAYKAEEELSRQKKLNVYHNSRTMTEAIKTIAEFIDLGKTSVIDLTYSGTEGRMVTDGRNYSELQSLAEQEAQDDRVIIIADWRPLRQLVENPQFYGMFANKRTAFLRHPFNFGELANTVARLRELPNLKDELAVTLANLAGRACNIGPLKHDLQPNKFGTPIAARAVEKINRLFGTNFDPSVDQQKASDFLDQHKEIDEGLFNGQGLNGVFCDIEGTLLDARTGEVNQQVLNLLDKYDRETFVRIWTGGDVNELRKKVASKTGRPWMVISKYDFRGSVPETVIDDMDKTTFEREYGINPKTYLRTDELSTPIE